MTSKEKLDQQCAARRCCPSSCFIKMSWNMFTEGVQEHLQRYQHTLSHTHHTNLLACQFKTCCPSLWCWTQEVTDGTVILAIIYSFKKWNMFWKWMIRRALYFQFTIKGLCHLRVHSNYSLNQVTQLKQQQSFMKTWTDLCLHGRNRMLFPVQLQLFFFFPRSSRCTLVLQ